MKRILLFIAFVSLMSACSSCGKKAANSADANANVAAENPFANITDPLAALAEGNRLSDENDIQMAIAAYKRAVELDPDLADAWFQLGIAYSLVEMQLERAGEYSEPAGNAKEGRTKKNSERAFEKAVDAYKKLLKANPNNDAAQFNLGRTYAKLNKDDEAEDAFREAVKSKPDDTEYLTELGAVLIKLARYREAIDPLKKAIALDDSNSRAADLLEDAEAGRQRLSYVAPNNTNTANANTNANTMANANSNSNVKNSYSNTVRKTPEANKPKRDDVKKPQQTANKPH